MSYQRVRRVRAMGDGPITDPSQVDDTVIAGEVNPTRVDCSALPDDSPWKRPGQVCAPTMWDRLLSFLANAVTPGPSTAPSSPAPTPTPDAPPAPDTASSASPFLMLGGLAAAYYLLRKKKRT